MAEKVPCKARFLCPNFTYVKLESPRLSILHEKERWEAPININLLRKGILSKLLAKNGVSISRSDVKHTSMPKNNRTARPSESECMVSRIDDIGNTGRDPNEEIRPLFGNL